MDDFSPKQYKALLHLAAGATNKEAAEASDVALRTIESWKNRDDFQAKLRRAITRVYDGAIAELVLGAQDAAKELRRMISDEDLPARTRLGAINTLLTHAAKAREATLEQRLENLEGLLDESHTEEN